jgi:hypothetical protein
MAAEKRFMQGALFVLTCFLILSAVCSAQESGPVTTPVNPDSVDVRSQQHGRFKASSNALEVARITGVDSDIARLSELTTAENSNTGRETSLEELILRQRITEGVVVASIDVDSVLEEVDYEREQIVELRSILRARRDRAIGSTNLAVLAAGTGLGIIGGLLQFSKTTSNAGNAVGLAAGGISTAFSLHGFRQVHGGRRPGWVLPNMLAAFFGQQEEQHSHYPEDVWAYLNSVPLGEGSQASRKQLVLDSWREAHRLGLLDSPQSKQRIALLTSTNAADKKLNIDVLNQRAAMLADVADQVVQMKQDLAEILRGLRR